jgi:hypothetical protein
MSAAIAAFMVATVLPVLGAAPATAADQSETTPLNVRLDTLAPSAIPAKGKIVLAGTVRNDSDETWQAINVHPVISDAPMTTREQLTAAAESDPALEIGERLLKIGQFAAIGDLLPGQRARFRITLLSQDLPITRAPGVYWIGVQALGQNADGRDGLADGRARTFIPLVTGAARTSVSLVVPVRERVRRDHTGKLLDTDAWSRTLTDNGRLERIAAFLNSAGPLPTTLLVDPAVIDAVASVASNNPAVSLGAAPSGSSGETPSPSPTDQASRSLDRLGPTDRANAARWLAQLKSAAGAQHVLGLGYADPDTAALARRRPNLITLAAKLAATAFTRFGISSIPTVAPASGWLDDEALGSVAPGSMVLVSDHAAPRTRTHWRTPQQQDLVFTDAQAASGGPGPTAPLDALALRQRIVSDAALRALDGSTSPMVVSLPADWDPGPGWQSADFFAGLNLSWFDLVALDPTTDPTTSVFDAALGYPQSERRLEVDAANVSATRTLISTSSVMSQLLRSTNDVKDTLTGIALNAVSYHARRAQATARDLVLATDTAMQSRLDKVSVIGTDFVTLSGGSGTLTVTLVNELDQPISVGIKANTNTSDVRIDAPKPLELAPGQRTVLRLHARASAIGVHEVTLTPVTADGRELGTPLTFSLRTSQVGKLIWGVLIAGGALLVVMILRRILRGIREHRWRGQ